MLEQTYIILNNINAHLSALFCDNNGLTTLNCQGLAMLQMLDCNNNQLTTLNCEGCHTLKELNCELNGQDASQDSQNTPNCVKYGSLYDVASLGCQYISSFMPYFSIPLKEELSMDIENTNKRERDDNNKEPECKRNKPD